MAAALLAQCVVAGAPAARGFGGGALVAQTPSDTIRAAVFDDWPPYYRWIRGTEPTGFAVEVLRAVARRADLVVRPVRFSESGPALAALADGSIDVVPNFGVSDPTPAGLRFTRPLGTTQLSIFRRESDPSLGSADDVAARRVGVVRDNSAETLVANRYPSVELVVYQDPRELLIELLSAGVDAAVYPQDVFVSLARTAGVDERIRSLEPALDESPRAMVLRSEREALAARLDAALDDLIGSPEYDEIYGRWFATPTPYWTVERVATLGGVLVLLVLTVMFVWRYRSVTHLADQLRGMLLERERAEEARRLEEARFATLVEASYEGIVLTDIDGRISFVNRRVCDLVAATEKELVGASIVDYVVPEHHERLRAGLARRREGRSDSYEVRLRARDGTERWVLLSAAPIQDSSGTAVGSVAALADIDTRVRAESELSAKTRLLQRTLSSLDAALFVIEARDRVIVECNVAAETIFGHPRDALIGSHTSLLHVSPAHAHKFGDALLTAFERGESLELEFVMRRADGTTFPSRHVVTPLDPERGVDGGVVSMVWDITDRKEAEQRLRLFYTRLQEAREDERANVAREIHDELGQTLTALKLDLGGLKRSTGVSGHGAIERVEQMERTVDRAIEDVRQISAELRPGLLDDLGLVSALEHLCEDFGRRSGIRCHLRTAVQWLALPPSVGIHVYRVAQEALTNVARHAQASEVTVNVSVEGTRGFLVVRDDGRGMPPHSERAPGALGIIGMQERARILGGHLEITSSDGAGTTVELVFPLGLPG